MARKTTDTKAEQTSKIEDATAQTPAKEAQEKTAGASDAAPATQDNAALPVAASEAGTARPASKNSSPASVDEVKAIIITGPKKGRWRAGRHFGPTPTTIPLEELSEEAAEALKSDPKLSIVPCPLNAADAGD